MDPSPHDSAERVRIHITLTARVRHLLRLVAAARGVTVAEVVSHWAVAEADGLGLRSSRVPDGR